LSLNNAREAAITSLLERKNAVDSPSFPFVLSALIIDLVICRITKERTVRDIKKEATSERLEKWRCERFRKADRNKGRQTVGKKFFTRP